MQSCDVSYVVQAHAAVAPPNSSFRCFRMLGWLYNEDGLWLG